MAETGDEGSGPEGTSRRRRRKSRAEHEAAPGGSDGIVLVGQPLSTGAGGGALLPALSLALVGGGLALGGGLRFVLGLAGGALALLTLIRGGHVGKVLQVEVDPTQGKVRFATNRGDDVVLPAKSVGSFEAMRHVQTTRSGTSSSASVSYRLLLHRADGAIVETMTFPRAQEQAARDAARDLDAALAEAHRRDASAEAPPDPLQALRAMPAFEVKATETATGDYRSVPAPETIEIAWSGQAAWAPLASGLAVIGAMSTFFLAFGQGAVVGAYLMGAFATFAVVLFLLTLGLRVRFRVDEASLTMEKSRFGRPPSAKRWDLEDVRAIDLSLPSTGPTLVVRVGDGPSLHQAAARQDLDGVASALLQHTRNQVPLGSLSIAEAFQLDLALSDAVARRKGVSADGV